jgi:hypothetical protein
MAVCLGIVAAMTSGCGGSSVDSACDVAGVTDEVGHILEESLLSLQEVNELACSGDWIAARITESGDGAAATPSLFIFQATEVGLILKAPETVCGSASEPRLIPEELVGIACETS